MPHRFSIDWFPLLPPSRLALVAGALLAILAWGSWVLARKQVPRRSIIALAVLRVVAVLLFVACLLQPAVSYFQSRPQSPELVVLVDTSASMGQVDGPNDATRLKTVTESIARSKMLDELGRKFQLKLFAFDRQAYPLDPSKWAALAPQGSTTDYAAAFAAAGDLLAAENESPATSASTRRVLLISDGQDHGRGSLVDAATRAGAIVDVMPAGTRREASTTGAHVADVQAPSRVLLASETKFILTLARSDDPPATYVVALLEDGKETLQQEVAFAAGKHVQPMQIAHRPTEAGLKRYEFELRPKSAAAGAPAAIGERYGVNVQVVDDKIEVLVLEDRWRWDFKYLKRVLEDDPSFHLTAMLARGGSAFVQMGEPEAKANLAGFPQSREELDRFDVIVLGDVRPTRWPAGLSGAVADAVIEDGKSLIVVAGPSLGEFAQIAELHTLLPVELSIDSASPVEGPLEMRLTPDGARSGLFADAGRAPGALPGVDRIYAPLRKRPAAAVLVEAASKGNTAGPLILMAEQTVGRGRVLYVGTDALWKWQTLPAADEDGRTPYEKLWQQALRAFTPQRTTAAAMQLAADRSRYEAGDRVTLRSQLVPAAGAEPTKLEASIVLPDERRLPLTFEPDAAVPEMLTASFDAMTPGRYRITSTATVDGQAVAQASTAIDVTAAGSEAEDRGVDHAALARIAARTGGRVVDPADPRSWPTTSAGTLPEIEERRTVNLWENFTLLTLLCLTLGADWLLRLMRGFVT